MDGIYTGVLLMPILPFIPDTEENILSIVSGASEAEAKFIYPVFGMALRDRQGEYYYEKLDEIFLDMQQRYISTYRNQYTCTASHVRKLYEMFTKECKCYGIL